MPQTSRTTGFSPMKSKGGRETREKACNLQATLKGHTVLVRAGWPETRTATGPSHPVSWGAQPGPASTGQGQQVPQPAPSTAQGILCFREMCHLFSGSGVSCVSWDNFSSRKDPYSAKNTWFSSRQHIPLVLMVSSYRNFLHFPKYMLFSQERWWLLSVPCWGKGRSQGPLFPHPHHGFLRDGKGG